MKITRSLALLMMLPLLGGTARAEADALPAVRLNQVGYRPGDAKVVCFVNVEGLFEVLRLPERAVVLSGDIGASKPDAASGDSVAYGDVSALVEEGEYIIATAAGESQPFRVAEDVYGDIGASALRFFYLQRCGHAFTEAEAGRHAHGACHTAPVKVYQTDIEKHITGGWHDAGDYGRYVSAAGKAVLDLLLTARDYPDAHGGALLHEVRYELDWLLQMQEEDGGVYHKLTSQAFAPLSVMPDAYAAPLVLSPVSATATGDFAGVCAYAAQIYRASDPEYAEALLNAAVRAHAWLAANPRAPGFKNPPGITTGEYGDNDDLDERALAAAALYLATGETKYQDELRPLLGRSTGMGWADMGLYAALIYLQVPEALRDEAMYERARTALETKAKALVRTARQEGYGVTLKSHEYVWGSNMHVANHGMVLLQANRYAPNAEYVRVAQDQLHYLLGRNGNAMCYVSGYGTLRMERPHHRPSVRAKAAMPGMLSGGPNSGLEDGINYNELINMPPARRYSDHWGSYATNEVTIYWNSPLVYLLAAFP